jgi:hypothetical protein
MRLEGRSSKHEAHRYELRAASYEEAANQFIIYTFTRERRDHRRGV